MHPSSPRGRAGPGTDGSFASVAMRPPGSPWYRHAGESALHERDHRGGDHPIPFRTRQLSPPSPKVLQRQAAGGQGAALMQGASAYIRGLSAFFWGYVSKSVSFGIIHCLYLVGIWNSSQTIPVPCSSGAPSSRFDSLDTAANSPSTSSSVGMTRRISAAGSGLSVCA